MWKKKKNYIKHRRPSEMHKILSVTKLLGTGYIISEYIALVNTHINAENSKFILSKVNKNCQLFFNDVGIIDIDVDSISIKQQSNIRKAENLKRLYESFESTNLYEEHLLLFILFFSNYI